MFCTCLKDEHKVADASLVEIGLTVWPKTGGLKPPRPPAGDGPDFETDRTPTLLSRKEISPQLFLKGAGKLLVFFF